MNRDNLIFQNISFAYDNSSYYLFDNLLAHFPAGWTGVVGANGVGKSTLLKLAVGEIKINSGRILGLRKAIYCPQRTDNLPVMFDKLLMAADSDACRIKGILGIKDDWFERWDTLSHGERKRVQISIALWQQPDCLAVDEPTNHLDREARLIVKNALQLYKGVGLLVSHDRELLDELCDQCLFIDPTECVIRPGGYTRGQKHQADEREYALKRKELANRKLASLKEAAEKRKDIAATQPRRRSKRGIPAKDSDAKSKIDMARVTGKDATGGRLLRQLDGRLKKARAEVESIQVKKTYRSGIWLDSVPSQRDTLFRLSSRCLSLGKNRSLKIPDLAMKPTDRIGIKGVNGSGKSTLVNLIYNRLDLPSERVIYLPQEIPAEDSQLIIAQTKKLAKAKLGHLMTIISSLGSRPERVLETEMLSPGELRKLMLAIGIANNAHLIIMDEPTNHLDLPSIECLENALADCTCGLLLVSHDYRFLDSLCDSYWEIAEAEEGSFELKVIV